MLLGNFEVNAYRHSVPMTYDRFIRFFCAVTVNCKKSEFGKFENMCMVLQFVADILLISTVGKICQLINLAYSLQILQPTGSEGQLFLINKKQINCRYILTLFFQRGTTEKL